MQGGKDNLMSIGRNGRPRGTVKARTDGGGATDAATLSDTGHGGEREYHARRQEPDAKKARPF
jgi:hypothetical protein